MSIYLLKCLLSVIICYFAGGIMFGIIISKLATKDDIRQHGSGNAGATNMLRVFGLKAGIVTFALDMLKCLGAILLCKYLLIYPAAEALDGAKLNIFIAPETVVYYCGFFTLLGHSFPAFFKFKGGKAASGALGVLYCLNWQIATAVFIVFVIVVLLTKTVSLGSILGATEFIILNFFLSADMPMPDRLYIILLGVLIGGLVIVRHKENIIRLRKGEEKPVSFKKQGN